MSGDEKDEKSFLSRWSQRKQDAKQSEADSTAERSAEEAEAAPAPVVESDAPTSSLISQACRSWKRSRKLPI